MADEKPRNVWRKAMVLWPASWWMFPRRPGRVVSGVGRADGRSAARGVGQTVNLGIATETDTAHKLDVSTALKGESILTAAPEVSRPTLSDNPPIESPAQWNKSSWGSSWGSPPSLEAEVPARSTTETVRITSDNGEATAILTREAQEGQRRPHLEGGTTEPPGNILLEDGGNLQLEGHAPEIKVTQAEPERGLNGEQLRQGIRQAFRGDKSAIAKWVTVAQETTAALQATLDSARINNPETVAEVRELLIFQKLTLENIQEAVEAGATDEAARKYQEWLARAAQTALRVMGEPGVIRGIVTVASLCTLGCFGAFSPAPAFLIAAGMMRLDKTTLEALAKFGGKGN